MRIVALLVALLLLTSQGFAGPNQFDSRLKDSISDMMSIIPVTQTVNRCHAACAKASNYRQCRSFCDSGGLSQYKQIESAHTVCGRYCGGDSECVRRCSLQIRKGNR